MDTSDWIALGVGGFAVIVATCALVWNIIRERARVRVKVWTGNPIDKSEPSKPPYEFIGVKTINNGSKPITIHDIAFVYSDGNLFRINFERPLSGGWVIPPGGSHDVKVPIEDLRAVMNKAAVHRKIAFARVQDATGKTHRGKIPKLVRQEIER